MSYRWVKLVPQSGRAGASEEKAEARGTWEAATAPTVARDVVVFRRQGPPLVSGCATTLSLLFMGISSRGGV